MTFPGSTLVYTFISILAQVLTFAVLIRALMSWFPMNPNNPLTNFIVQVTEPVLGPIRRILPRVGMFDFSPLVAIVIFQVIASVAGRVS